MNRKVLVMAVALMAVAMLATPVMATPATRVTKVPVTVTLVVSSIPNPLVPPGWTIGYITIIKDWTLSGGIVTFSTLPGMQFDCYSKVYGIENMKTKEGVYIYYSVWSLVGGGGSFKGIQIYRAHGLTGGLPPYTSYSVDAIFKGTGMFEGQTIVFSNEGPIVPPPVPYGYGFHLTR